MAYRVTACRVMACVVMAYVGMTYVVDYPRLSLRLTRATTADTTTYSYATMHDPSMRDYTRLVYTPPSVQNVFINDYDSEL